MAHHPEAGLRASFATNFASAALAPLRVVDRCLQSVIAANRLGKELENALHANQDKLNDMGVSRDEVVQHVAQRSANFRAL